MKQESKNYDKAKSVDVAHGWTQGFICALCCVIRLEGMVSTLSIDLYGCSSFKIDRDIDSYNIDESDRELLLKHKDELTNSTTPQ